MSDDKEIITVHYLGLSADGKSKVIDVEGSKGHWPKSVKEFRVVGGLYDVAIVRKDGKVASMYNGTAIFGCMADLSDEDVVRHAAGSKQMTMKKIENKFKKNFDIDHLGQMTLNQIGANTYNLSSSERAALLSKIACYVGLF